MKKISLIQFPQQQAQIPAKMKATVAYSMFIEKAGYSGVLVLDGTGIEITFSHKEIAPGYLPKVGDKVIFDSGNRGGLEFPYMLVSNIRRRVGL